MTIAPEVTTKSITILGGLLATGAAVIAESVSTDPAVGAGSFILGGAGLIAAISAFAKDYWSDRQKQRDHEISVLRIKLRTCRSCNAVHELYSWARSAHNAVSALPAVPELRLDDAVDSATEKRDA